MERPVFNHDALAARTDGASWTYWRPMAEGIVEFGILHGSRVGLPVHFHDEDQITFVLSGRRRFLVKDEVIALIPGQGILIPAAVPHRSLAEPSGVVCLNAYVPAGQYAVAAMMKDIERLWRTTGQIRWTDLAAAIREHRQGLRTASATDAIPVPTDGCEPVSRVAARMGMSREGFSRMFVKGCGMPPHTFWLMRRLNRARELLRAGEAIAAVAAETGFADQSHLGRWFRRAFGVSPGRYRVG